MRHLEGPYLLPGLALALNSCFSLVATWLCRRWGRAHDLIACSGNPCWRHVERAMQKRTWQGAEGPAEGGVVPWVWATRVGCLGRGMGARGPGRRQQRRSTQSLEAAGQGAGLRLGKGRVRARMRMHNPSQEDALRLGVRYQARCKRFTIAVVGCLAAAPNTSLGSLKLGLLESLCTVFGPAP